MGIQDVPANLLIAKLAERLKSDKVLQSPEWAAFAKTGAGRNRPPQENEWWFTRGASLLRQVALHGPIGTQKLRVHYGNRKNMGHAPERTYIGAGNNIRKILQQLDKAGLSKHVAKEVHKGRVLTPKGQEMLDNIAYEITKELAAGEKK